MDKVNTAKAWALGVAMDAMDFEELITTQDEFFLFADRVLDYVTEDDQPTRTGFQPTLVN